MERSPLRKWSWWQFLMQLGGSEPLLSCRPQETEITTWPPKGKLYPKHIHLSVCSSCLQCNFRLQPNALFRRHKGVSPLSMTQFRYKVLNESVNNVRMFLKSTSWGLLCWRLFIRLSSVCVIKAVFVWLALKMIFLACKAYQEKLLKCAKIPLGFDHSLASLQLGYPGRRMPSKCVF